MNYNISVKKLAKLANPYNPDHQLFSESITKKEVETALAKNAIFSNNSPKDKILADIAYRVSNYYPEEISIILDTGINISHGLIDLAAAIYRNEKTIVGMVEGDKPLVKALLGVDLGKPSNIVLPKEPTGEPFNWEINQSLLENTWGDPEFLLGKMSGLKGERLEAAVIEIVELATPEIWSDPQFVEKLLNTHYNMVELLPKKAFEYPLVLDLIKNQPEDFLKAWDKSYKEQWQEEVEQSDIPNTYQLKNEDINNPIIFKIKTEILSDKEFIKKLLKSHNNGDKIYPYCTVEMQYDWDILETIYKSRRSDGTNKLYIYPEEYPPEEYTKDNNWTKEFLVRFGDVILSSDTSVTKLSKAWIENKQDVLEVVDQCPHKEIYYLYKILPPKLKDDAQVVQVFYKKSPSVFYDLSTDDKREYLVDFMSSGKKFATKDIPLVLEMDNRDLLVKLLAQNHYSWLESKDCPNKWKEDADLIIKSGSGLRWLLSDSKIMATLTKNTDILIQAVGEHEELYGRLSSEKCRIPEVALANIAAGRGADSALFNSKSFCLEALTKGTHITKNIPDQFWNSTEFLLTVCRGVDQDKISNDVFNKGPARVLKMFEAFSITDNYEKFINGYILNTKLNENLTANATKVKKNKI